MLRIRTTRLRFAVLFAATIGAFALAPAVAADLGAGPQAIEEPAAAPDLKAALSRFLAVLEIRASFDVVDKDAIDRLAADQLAIWQRSSPSGGELAELDRQLLAEASYYLVGLRYLVDVGGAAFPVDRAELDYRNDTLVRIDALLRHLPDLIASAEDPAPLLAEAEAVRALTEGYTEVPADLGVFLGHAARLDAIWTEAQLGTRT